jgi:L-ascorbate metabolism protein UlaG (beta-lactamase superfamily)
VPLSPGTQSQYTELVDRLRLVDPWETTQIGPFTVTAVPAVDGLGEAQVSYAITADGKTVLHAGDTTFHGAWWRIAERVGPIDLALLPINGAVVNFPWLQPASPLPAALTPEQAVVAARALRAGTVGPIHYGGFDLEPFYASIVDAPERLHVAAQGAGLPVSSPAPGSLF